MNEPYNCQYNQIGATQRVMCRICGRIREIASVPADRLHDLCQVRLRGTPKHVENSLSVSQLTQTLGSSNMSGIGLLSGMMCGIRGGGLDSNVVLSLDNDCLMAILVEPSTYTGDKLIICYDKIRNAIWSTLGGGSGSARRTIRWSRDHISQKDIISASNSGSPIILLFESNDGYDMDPSGSMVILPIR